MGAPSKHHRTPIHGAPVAPPNNWAPTAVPPSPSAPPPPPPPPPPPASAPARFFRRPDRSSPPPRVRAVSIGRHLFRERGADYDGQQIDHGVLVVGYGTDAASSLGLARQNQWGIGWGDGGYFKIEAGVNLCGIESDVSYW